MRIANGAWRSFKATLVNKYKRKNKTPFAKYSYINKKTWEKFVKLKSTEEFESLSLINREHAKKNDNPHHFGSRGYLGKQDSWAREIERGIMPEVHNMYNKRTRNFILGRRVKSSGPEEFVLPDKMKPIAEALIEKDKQFSQGDWDPEVAIDPLVAVLGPEHPGRTRGVSHIVGLRVGLGLGNKKRKRNQRTHILEERTRVLEEQVQQLLAERLSKNDATAEGGSGLRKSSVGSTACDPQIESIKDVTPCDLVFRCGGAKILVAKGQAFPLSNNILHGYPLEEGFMKVMLDMVIDGFEEYDLPVPIDDDIKKLGQAVGNFIQWEQCSVVLRQVAINKLVVPPTGARIHPHVRFSYMEDDQV